MVPSEGELTTIPRAKTTGAALNDSTLNTSATDKEIKKDFSLW